MNIENFRQRFERQGFTLFLVMISVGLAFIAWPFLSALLWAVLAAIMFQPLYRWLLRHDRTHENKAAFLVLLIITFTIVVPMIFIGTMVVDEASNLYVQMQSQQIDVAAYFIQIHNGLPDRIRDAIDEAGYGNLANVQDRISIIVQESIGLIASQAVSIGSGAISFVLSFFIGLYVAYFLLRDGRRMVPFIAKTLPMREDIARSLLDKFAVITRATVKGSLVVGIVQGALGAITFAIIGVPSAILLGVLMAIASLLPALGPALVWAPVAVYLLLTGSIWQGAFLIGSGALVIGMADNVLRPILVGRDTGIPDWLILVTTLGGIASMGLSGIIIGPVVAGLFMASWSIAREQKEAFPSGDPEDSGIA